MTPIERAAAYAAAFPSRAPLAATADWLTGTWLIGACYKNPNPLYGAYPHGYLERVHSMFPDARSVLHVFSGGLTHEAACEAAFPNGVGTGFYTMELVDLHGPEQGRHPTWQGDLFEYCAKPPAGIGKFDLILADPPYSTDDAVKYDVPMVSRGAVLRSLASVCKPGGHLVWLDQVWPMHRKAEWKCWGQVGLVRSTNHRVRLVSMFERVGGAA